MKLKDDSFEAWMRRPVYVVQCLTVRLARQLNVSCATFRCLPAYRDAQSKAARQVVAEHLRKHRALYRERTRIEAVLEQASACDPSSGLAKDQPAATRLKVRLYHLQREIARLQ